MAGVYTPIVGGQQQSAILPPFLPPLKRIGYHAATGAGSVGWQIHLIMA